MINNVSGSYNTAVGTSSLYALTSGNHNICIGHFAGENMVNGTNQILIGHGCNTKNEDDTMVIGGNVDSKIIKKWYPGTDSETELGSSSIRFNNLYVNNIYVTSITFGQEQTNLENKIEELENRINALEG